MVIIIITIINVLPLHLCPSPMYPALHVQLYDPLVLLHTALASHLWVFALHSLISVKQVAL